MATVRRKKKRPALRIGFLIVLLLVVCIGVFFAFKALHKTNNETGNSQSSAISQKKYNQLTGKAAEKQARPVAVMVSNANASLPQSGIGSADIVYETLTEGGITRLMCLYSDDQKIEKVGPVRSVRNYYIDLAKPFDALVVHFGGSDTGKAELENLNMQHIDGNTDPEAFTQDQSRANSRGREHSFFTASSTLDRVVESKKIDMNRKINDAFFFAKGEVNLASGAANKVKVPFSSSDVATFDYDAGQQKYLKGQFGKAQIDANTGQQVAVDNVFVLFTDITGAADGSIRRDVSLNSGIGYYFYHGNYTPITWSKGKPEDPISLLNEEGDPLQVAQGQSWICIAPNDMKGNFSIS